MTIKIIDPHLHLFNVSSGKYAWWASLKDSQRTLFAKDMRFKDIELCSPLKLEGFVHIEAGFDNEASWKEVDFIDSEMEDVQTHYACIGYADITGPNSVFTHQLSQLRLRPSFAGIRHIFEGNESCIPSTTHLVENMQTLAEHQLILECQLPLNSNNENLITCLMNTFESLPSLKVCLTHAGFPPLSKEQFSIWQAHISNLASLTNVWVKCSGFDMFDVGVLNTPQFRKHITRSTEVLVQHFGDSRVMFASNFPLILTVGHYQQYWELVYQILQQQQLDTHKLLNQNARHFYALNN